VKRFKDICALAAVILIVYGVSFFPAGKLVQRYPGAVAYYNSMYYPMRYAFAERYVHDTRQQLEPFSQLCFLEVDSRYLEFAPELSRASSVSLAAGGDADMRCSLDLHPKANIANIRRLKPGDLFTPVLKPYLHAGLVNVGRDYLTLNLIDVIPAGEAVDRKTFQDAYPVRALNAGYVDASNDVERFEFLAGYYRSGRYRLIWDILDVVSPSRFTLAPMPEKRAFLIGWSSERIRQSLGVPCVVRTGDDHMYENHIPVWLEQLKLQPNGTECLFWYNNCGPPDHTVSDSSYNLYFLLRDGVIIGQDWAGQ
jgi:hypothetical protein